MSYLATGRSSGTLEWEGPEFQESMWFVRCLEHEHDDNLRAAMSWLARAQEEPRWPYAWALLRCWFWQVEEMLIMRDGPFLQRALEGSEEVASPVRAKALFSCREHGPGMRVTLNKGKCSARRVWLRPERSGDTKGMELSSL